MHNHHEHQHHPDRTAREEVGPGFQGALKGRRLRHVPPWARGGHPMGGPARRGRRSRRGEVRAAVLLLLEEEPRNGYQLIQELSERSGGAWRPSPGSVYPVLAQLQDEGLVAPDAASDGRVFGLTEAGRAEVEAKREAFGKPWDAAAKGMGGPRVELLATARQAAAAIRQVVEAGTDDQVTRVTEVLGEARRRIYLILAEDPVPRDEG
jgi:DNA-binding PadR family transcriptional regulator